MFLSAESFAFDMIQMNRLETLLQPWTNKYIIIYYRRFYDWLHSQWNQLNKVLPVQERESFSKWMSSIDKIRTKFYDNHYTYSIIPRWKEHFPNVKIYNMHNTFL